MKRFKKRDINNNKRTKIKKLEKSSNAQTENKYKQMDRNKEGKKGR